MFYYLDIGGKPRREIALGSDYALAIKKWTDLIVNIPPKKIFFANVINEYKTKILPTKSIRSQKDDSINIEWILKFFDDPPAPIDAIEPVHIRQYMDWRVEQSKKLEIEKNKKRIRQGKDPLPIPINHGHVQANRNIALFSHIWNFAREYGYTNKTNPCTGVRKYKEKGRIDVSISDETFKQVLQHSDKQVEFTLRLAYLTGQRPADVLRMSENDINNGFLHLKQGKTNAKLRIEIVGELLLLLNEMIEYKNKIKNYVHSVNLLVNEKGQPLTHSTFRSRFDKARKAANINKQNFQLRDMRSKAATQINDNDGIRSAQKLLGHTTENMTAHYIRNRVGTKVKPVK